MDALAKASKFDRRKDAIVEAAIPLLNTKGVRGATLPLVAARLGLAPRAVSYYFRRKEELAAACFRLSIHRLDAIFSEALRLDRPDEALAALVAGFFEFRRAVAAGEEPEIAWFEEMRTIQDPAVGEEFVDLFRKVRGLFARPGLPPLDRVQQNGRTHQLLSQLFWAVLWLPRYHAEDYGWMGGRLTDIMLKGLAANGRPFAPVALAPPSFAGEPAAVSRHAFLRAATELINEQGYLGASVSKISARLKVSKGAFYYHNDAKNDLVEQCFEETWATIRAVQIAARMVGGDGLSNLAAQTAHLVEGQVSGEGLLLRTSALAAVPEEMRFRLLAGFDRATFHFASVVSDGIADGSIRAVDAPLAAQAIAGGVNAASELRHWVRGVTPRAAVDAYMRPLFTGLLSP